jgi:hypothetical protein
MLKLGVPDHVKLKVNGGLASSKVKPLNEHTKGREKMEEGGKEGL